MGGNDPFRWFTGAYDSYSNTWITGGTEFDWSYTSGSKPVNSFWVSHTREYSERLRMAAFGFTADLYSSSYKYRLYQCVDGILTDITDTAVEQKPKKHYCINTDPNYPYLEGSRAPEIINTIDLGTTLDYSLTNDPGPAWDPVREQTGWPIKVWCGGLVNSDGSSAGGCETDSAPNNCAHNIPTGTFTQGQYSGPTLELNPVLFTNCAGEL
jgi:hypothetical protein